jgi:hypothetical protein
MTLDSPSQPDLLDEVVAAYLRAIENGDTRRKMDRIKCGV